MSASSLKLPQITIFKCTYEWTLCHIRNKHGFHIWRNFPNMGQWCEPMQSMGWREIVYKYYTAQPVIALRFWTTYCGLHENAFSSQDVDCSSHVGTFLVQKSSNSNQFCTQYNESFLPSAPDLFLLKRKH